MTLMRHAKDIMGRLVTALPRLSKQPVAANDTIHAASACLGPVHV